MYSIIQHFVTFGVLVPILIGVTSKIYLQKELFSIFLLLLCSLVVELISITFITFNFYTLSVFNLFAILEFVLLWNFYSSFVARIKATWFNNIVLFVFLLVASLDLLFVNGFKRMNDITISVESITLIIYSLISFYLIMSRMLFDKLLDEPFFWINIAVLFYFSGSLFLFLFGNYLISQGNKAYMEMYKIHTFVNAVWYFFISIGFWKVKKA